MLCQFQVYSKVLQLYIHVSILFQVLFPFRLLYTLLYLKQERFFFNKFILFIYFWLHWVFAAACRLSLVAVSGGYSLLPCVGFSLPWLLLLQSTGSRCTGFSSCSTWAQQLWLAGSRAQAQQCVVHGLSCSAACGIFPDQGSNPCSLNWQADS